MEFIDLWIAGPCQGGMSTLLTDLSEYGSYRDDMIAATSRFEMVDGSRIIEWEGSHGTSRLTLFAEGGTVEYISRLDTHPGITTTISSTHYLELANVVCALLEGM